MRLLNRDVDAPHRARALIDALVVDRLIDEAMLRLHAEERELDQLEALERRHVTVDDTR